MIRKVLCRGGLAGLVLGILSCACGAESLHASIDRLIAEKAGGPFAERSNDAEFLRRITLDLSGQIPTPAEVRAFLNDESPQKRSALIDKLLASGKFAAHWTDRLSVMLLERQNLGKVSEEEWRQYLMDSLRGQPRWNTMVSDMIAATGQGPARPAMKFLGNGNHQRMTEDVARLLLGRDLQCARCHDHPSVDDWKQADYWGLFAYLNQTKAATHGGDKQVYLVETLATKKLEFQSVFTDDKEETGPRLPGLAEVAIPEFDKDEAFEKPAVDGLPAVPRFRPRERLAADLTSGSNRAFVRNSVNRFWFLMMGRGLTHPLDQTHGENPPSHPQLLDLLEHEFAKHDFDLKWLLREIASSESYQRSSRSPEGTKESAPASYRAFLPKGLTPEQLLHATLRATGNTEQVRAQTADPGAEKFDRRGYFTGTEKRLPPSYKDIRALFVETFAQPAGVPEDDFAPGLNKALFLMNDRLILHWLQPRDNNLVARLETITSPQALAEELYLVVLSRFPGNDERQEVVAYLEAHHDRRTTALGDLVWALLSSTEFRLNH